MKLPSLRRSALCLFKYYGSKRGLAATYPAPRHDTVIEPFAGSAAYSCCHYQKKVVLFEKDPKVYGILDYIIHASPEEIMRLPRFYGRENVDDFPIPQEAKWLIGFWLGVARWSPGKTRSPWGSSPDRRAGFWGESSQRCVAEAARKTKHWRVYNLGWDEIDVARYGPACWFVDPPYQKRGTHYTFGSAQIDFPALGRWCQGLPGQVIACENRGADWLPFRDLYLARANAYNNGGSVEVIWTKGCAPRGGFGLL